MENKGKVREYGITLVALIITIIILLILAGIVIATLNGESGLLGKVKKIRKTDLEAQMKEQLILALYDLQSEKEGNATLDDVTQEWLENKIDDYSPNLKEDASLNGKLAIMIKNNVTGKFLIDEKLNITDIEYNSGSLEFEYEAKSRNGDNIEILIKVRDNVNGIKQIDYPDGRDEIISNNKNDYIGIDYTVELGKEYKFSIITGDGDKIEKILKIDDYYYNVTKTLEDGATIDNNSTKTAYNKKYEATISTLEDYEIISLIVTMGGRDITTGENDIVNMKTGKIFIKEVTGDIEISVKVKQQNKLDMKFIESSGNTGTVKFSNGEYTLSGQAILESENAISLDKFKISLEVKDLSRYYNGTSANNSFCGLIIGVGTSGAYTQNRCMGIADGWGGDVLNVFTGTGGYPQVSKKLLKDGWNEISIIYDGSILKMCLNGEVKATYKTVKFFNTKLYVGGWSDAPYYASGNQWGFANGIYRNIKVYEL